jgi:chromosome segregation ATPase
VGAAEKIAMLAAVKTQQATLDKALEQRRSDSNKTKHKHPDFPSIPELQNRYRHRDDRLRQELDDEEKKVRAELADVLGQLPSNPPAPNPLVETQAHAKESQSQLQSLQKDVDSKIETVNKALQAHQGSSKGDLEVLKAQVEVLKKQLVELKSQEADQKDKVEWGISTVQNALQQEVNALREQSAAAQARQAESLRQDLLAQFDNQSKQMESRLLDQLKRQLKQEEDESKAQLRKQEEEAKAYLKSQVEAFSAQLKQQQELIAELKKQQEELSAQLTRHQEASTAEFRKQNDISAKYSAKSSDTALSKDLAAIRKDNAKLKTDYNALRADFSSALLRVDELEKREAPHGERATSGDNDFKALSESVTICLQKVEEQAERISKSEETLMNLDIQGLIDLVEVSVAFPQVQHQVKEQQNGLKELKGEVDRINGFNDEVLNTVGSWVDELRKTDTAQGTKIQALTEQVAALETAGSHNPAPVEDSTTKAEVASVKEELDGFSVHTKAELDAVRKKNKETTEFLTQQISVLDQRYNNLTTKDMAERILGVMESVYPNAKNIAATLKLLQNTVESQKMQLAGVEEEGKATKRRVSETESRCGQLEAMLEPIVRHSRERKEQATREIEQHARKRARKDGYPNGMGRSASNGVVYANGVNGDL